MRQRFPLLPHRPLKSLWDTSTEGQGSLFDTLRHIKFSVIIYRALNSDHDNFFFKNPLRAGIEASDAEREIPPPLHPAAAGSLLLSVRKTRQSAVGALSSQSQRGFLFSLRGAELAGIPAQLKH